MHTTNRYINEMQFHIEMCMPLDMENKMCLMNLSHAQHTHSRAEKESKAYKTKRAIKQRV